MKKTRNPRIWFQYLCWTIQFWMMIHRPHVVPSVLRVLITRLWMRTWPTGEKPKKLPAWLHWIWVAHLPGWSRVEQLFRRCTGGRSHRCEFTDPHHGALYGYNEGAFMNKLFEQFIRAVEDREL
jgi:hypothetical protein